MIINSEEESKVCNLNITFEEGEYSNLLDYAKKYMPEERKNELMIEWALVDLLKLAIEENKNE